jgi:hypothetical protein
MNLLPRRSFEENFEEQHVHQLDSHDGALRRRQGGCESVPASQYITQTNLWPCAPPLQYGRPQHQQLAWRQPRQLCARDRAGERLQRFKAR